jgi:hypothetical protein
MKDDEKQHIHVFNSIFTLIHDITPTEKKNETNFL